MKLIRSILFKTFLKAENAVLFQGLNKLNVSITFHSCFLVILRYAEGGSHMTMVHMQTLSEIENLPYTKWNIQQPSEVDEKHDCLHTGGLDLILTPGLAFTKEGFRLGRGKGYYDSFIRNYSSSYNRPYLIGLSLSPSLVSNIPITDTDVKMDEVIYEMEINE